MDFEVLKKLNEIQLTLKSHSEALASLQEGQQRIMATIADLDAAIAAEKADLDSFGTSVQALTALATQLGVDIAALIAKAQNGEDFSAELTALQANKAELDSTIAAVAAAQTSIAASDAAAAGGGGPVGNVQPASPQGPGPQTSSGGTTVHT
jgi:chromosome segregation ATPase